MNPGDGPLERILLHVDAIHDHALAPAYALALGEAYGALVHAVFVVNRKLLDTLTTARVFVEEEVHQLTDELEQDGERHLRAIERMAAAHNLTVTTAIRTGIPHREVVQEAFAIRASIIVLDDIEVPLSVKDAFGNESEMILWTAPCPVLVVKGKAPDELARSWA
ncbi:MAG: universal stress protein [Candidatus Hydrogenedentes bacterium]|nr:universal stress protein [Candidatus Hydrogenedentota bacterium]